jgi:selenocysteine lyase/cysteine desulfurase
MNRRDFLATGAGGALGSAFSPVGTPSSTRLPGRGEPESASSRAQSRAAFARLDREVFIDAAGGTPLSSFAESGLRKYEDFWRLGPGEGRGEYFGEMLNATRQGLARLIGARPGEIAFVQCTKQGEQIVLDGIQALRDGGNLVTNDLHFAGSLHNLVGLRATGLDLRIVRSQGWQTDLEAMAAAIDDATALVSVTLVSNVNGHIEPMRDLADLAHAHGAHVYADIIQAAGIVPVDVRAMGIDFAAGNGYKWLFGPHGAGFLYVREELQGTVLEDRMFPGHVRHNYAPWVDAVDPARPDLPFQQPNDAARYQPGHSAYLCYAAVNEGLRFIEQASVEALQAHSATLNQRLLEGLDVDRYRCISPHVDRAPIITFQATAGQDLEAALRAGNLVVSLSGRNQIRVSPAVYNEPADIDLLAEVLNRA